MKLNIFKFLIVIGIIPFMVSCDDEFYEKNNLNELSSDSFWNDLNATSRGLTATYSTLMDHAVLGILEEAWRSDMGWPGYGRPTAGYDPGITFYTLNYNNGTPEIGRKWDALYQGIFRANQVIEALDGLQGTVDETEWTSQMAQARFLRGLFHFYLHSTYNNGNIIIRNSVPKTQEDFNTPISPSAEVIEFFRADLEYAYENLPPSYDSANLGRATAGAAGTILGTSYLYEEEYGLAIPVFDDVINNSKYGYELVRDMNLMFSLEGEHNSESIFEINYNLVHRQDLVSQWNELSHHNRLEKTTELWLGGPAWISDAYRTEVMDVTDDRNYYPDPDSPTGRSLRNVPLRASAMINLVDDEQTLLNQTASVSENMINESFGWGFALYRKYLNFELPVESIVDWKSGKNVTVNRLAEVYLMQAESYIKTGNLNGAIDLINEVRSRWALQLLGTNGVAPKYDGIVYTAESLMNHLMFIEKPLETSIEGHAVRWIDLRRWGVIKQNLEKLANAEYHLVDYTFIGVEGGSITRPEAAIRTGNGGVIGPANALVDYEYDVPNNSYDSVTHDYYPIPISEVNTNPSID